MFVPSVGLRILHALFPVHHTGGSSYQGFRYPRFYFSIMNSINIVSVDTVEAAAQAQ
jgi:hypothetical protein